MGDVVGQAWWEADLKDEKLKAKLRELDGLLRRQGAESEQQLNRGWSAALDNAGRSMEQLGKRVTSTGDAMTRNLTLPIVGAGLAVGKLALDFDTTLRQTVGLAGVAADSIGGIRSEILKMAGEVGKGPQELAEAFYFVASAGFEADEAMTVLKVSAKAAASGLGETQTIAQVLGGVINAYGKENMTAARAADILTEAVAQGTAEASGFASVIGNVVPGAAALGVSFDQVTAAMAGMTLSGVGVEEAATSLINIFSSLQKPTVQAEEALEGLGLSSAELRKQLREEGLLATLRTLEERFAGNETASAAVFGNIRALRGVTALLGLDTQQLNDVFAEVEDSLDRQEEAYKATEGPQRELARSMAELQATAIELGEDVLPVAVDVLKQLAGGAKELAAWWRTLDDDTKKMVVQLALLIAVAGPVLSIVGKLTTGLGGLLKVIAFLGGPATMAKVAAVGVAFRALLGPVGLALAAVEALKWGLNEVSGGALEIEQAFMDAAHGTGDFKGALDEAIAAAERADIPFDEFKKSVVRTMQETGATWDEAVRQVEHGTFVVSSALKKSGEDWESYQKQIAVGTADAVDAAALEAAGFPPEIAGMLAETGQVVEEGMSDLEAALLAAEGKTGAAALRAFGGIVEAARAEAALTPQAIAEELGKGDMTVSDAADALAGLIPASLIASALEAVETVRALPGDIAAAIIEGRDEVVVAATGLATAATDPLVNEQRIAETRAALADLATMTAEEIEDATPASEAARRTELAKLEIMLAGYILRADPASKEAMGLLAKYAVSEDDATQLAYDEMMTALEDRAFVMQHDIEGKAAAAMEAPADAAARERARLEQEAYAHFLSTLPPAQQMADEVKTLADETAVATENALRGRKVRAGLEAESYVGHIRNPFTELGADGYTWGFNLGQAYADGLYSTIPLVEGAARGVASATGRQIGIQSEPKDPHSPLAGITKWGGNIVRTIVGGMMAQLGMAERASAALAATLSLGAGSGVPMGQLNYAGAAAATGEASVGSSVAAALGSAGNVAPVHIEKHTHVHPVGPVPVETDDDLRRLIERTDWIGEDGAWTNG